MSWQLDPEEDYPGDPEPVPDEDEDQPCPACRGAGCDACGGMGVQ